MLIPRSMTCGIVAIGLMFCNINAIAQAGPALSTVAPAQPSLTDELTKLIEEQREQLKLPGVTVAVVRDRDIIYKHAAGYSNLEKKTPTSLEQPQPIGSVTKVFAATMLMQLVEKGVVRLDDPVVKYVPEYKVTSPFPNTQPTTLRQLASHTSGLPRDAGANFPMNFTLAGWMASKGTMPLEWYVSRDALLKSLPAVELEYAPNSGYHYSNLGMCLLGIALERAAGVPFEKYIEANILKPLGMNHSGFINDSNQQQFPVGYVHVSPQEEPLVAPKWEMRAASYTGGMYSTAEDLAKLVSLQFQESPVGGPQILSADSLRAMRLTTGDYSGPDYSAGIGWWGNHVGGHHFITHNGGHLGFLATASAMPDMKLGVVVLTNRCNPMSDMQTAQLARKIFEVLVPRLGASDQVATFDPAKIDFQRYAGTYTVVGGASQIAIQVENGNLYQTVLNTPAPRMQLFPAAQDQFSHAPGQPAVVAFESDNNGRITGLSFALFRFRRVK